MHVTTSNNSSYTEQGHVIASLIDLNNNACIYENPVNKTITLSIDTFIDFNAEENIAIFTIIFSYSDQY